MELFLLFVVFLLIIVGIIGSIVPALPGPPLGWGALLILKLLDYPISDNTLLLWGVVVAVISLLDYFVSPLLTRKAGGSRSSVIGSMVGVLLALFVFPVSIMLGAFLGAFIGELIHDSSDVGKALVVGFYSFLGFVVGTFMKLVVTIWMLWVAIRAVC